MKEFERSGLLQVDEAANMRLTKPLGFILIRNVAAAFDVYLDQSAYCQGEGHFSANA